MVDPIVILAVGVVTVVGMILVLRTNAFLALITAAIVVSLLSPGPPSEAVGRVAATFGDTAGKIGIVIALAAVIGKCLMDSGAADRIVRAFLRLFGEQRAAPALATSGFVLAMPVFFDTVFYLLVPLARSLGRRTGKHYTLYLLAIAAGGVVAHSLVPPTPGPLAMAGLLSIDLGTMIVMGTILGLPTTALGLLAAAWLARWTDVPMRPYQGEMELEPLAEDRLPPLGLSLLPVLLPVAMISADTVVQAAGKAGRLAGTRFEWAAEITPLLGNPNLALLLAAAVAMLMLVRARGLSLAELGRTTETALTSGGVIILITAAGGAFGAMLREAGIKEWLQQHVIGEGGQGVGLAMLCLGFAVATLMKIAQGSGTVSMITTCGIFAALGATPDVLGFHPVYLAAAIGNGSIAGSWMNDSGFWIFSRMGVLSEVETLRTWSALLALVGLAGLGVTLLAAWLVPLV